MKMDPASHSIIKDISKWITNLKMKRTALKIGDLMQEEYKTLDITQKDTFIYLQKYLGISFDSSRSH